jgi:pimeloyl-ACP methyl ester carboxylesterase
VPVTIEDDRPVTFESGGVVLAGSFRGPAAGSNPVAAAVLVAGSGAVDRDENAPAPPGVRLDCLRWLADRCADAGVATLRYDKFGVGDTGPTPFGSPELVAWDFGDAYVQPARDALRFLADRPGIDASRLLVVGHSEGGGIALAVRADPGDGPAPAGLALIEPLYERTLDAAARQLTDHVQAAGFDPSTVAAFLASIEAAVDEIRTSTAPFEQPLPLPVPGASGPVAEAQQVLLASLERFRNRSGQTEDLLDPVDLAATIDVPTLLTVGTKDFNTPRSEAGGGGIDRLEAAFAPGIVDYVIVPNMHHTLRDLGDADMMLPLDQVVALPFSERFADAFAAFLAPWASR